MNREPTAAASSTVGTPPADLAQDATAERVRAARQRHPRFREAVRADARVTAAYRGERYEFRSRADLVWQCLRLMVVSDAFFAQTCYRLKARLQALGVPVLPRLAHRAAMVLGQVTIGDPVVIAPGLYLLHGQVVIDGITEIGPGARIAPFVTIGLQAGSFDGPRVGANVSIGTGAKVLGAVEVGNGATIGANAVVISDVPPRATAVGIPARVHAPPTPS
jgi:serine O-acetyltransferase